MTAPATDAISMPLTSTTPVQGRFLWYDLMVPDVEAATRFYPAVTGWTLTPWAMGDGVAPYTMWTNDAVPVGGVMAQPGAESGDGPAAHWLAYIGTSDVDATYQDALALGARAFVAPTDIPTVGRFAVLADPQGATFAIYQPANPTPPIAGTPVVGAFCWHELATTDRAAAFDFYARLFGWVTTEASDTPHVGVYQMFGQEGATYGGMFTRMHDAVRPHWLLYVHVADMDRAVDAVRQGGGAVVNGPMPVPGGDHVAHCVDPQGAHFAVHASGPAIQNVSDAR